MKKVQRSSFKLNPIAASIAIAMASQFAAGAAYAGSGWGTGVNTSNAPMVVQTYYANSPAGLVPALDPVTGLTSLDPVTNLPVVANTGTALRKFVDTLPGMGATNANNLGQYIPVAVPEKWVDLNGNATNDDYYEIAAVEFTEKMHTDLSKPTHLRGYVQLSTAKNPGKQIPLIYPNGTPILDAKGVQVLAYDNPHHLGPIINSTTGVAVRVKFSNYLPVGGELFLPVDTTITGAGLGPDGVNKYTQNRAEMHLVGGQSPWISAGSPHQWVAPAGETAAYAANLGKGASVQNVPDMADPGNGSNTLYFPNTQSARFMFIQDRTSGLTRLNSYAGLEAGYFVTDAAEQGLIASSAIPADQIPLIIEDKTFVPVNVAQQDAKWDTTYWGQPGDLWFPHVYEPNQDTGAANGVNPVGRWDFGPLFWPIFAATAPLPSGVHGDASFTPEAYADTPLINGTAYPTLTLDPKAYRFRILNASSDRFINLGWYKADATASAPQLDQNGNPIFDANGNQLFFTNTEVKMVPALADATGAPLVPVTTGAGLPYDPTCLCEYPTLPQIQPAIQFSGPNRAWPTDGRNGGAPDPAAVGPDFIVIGNDGGLLPNPVDVPSQPVTYEQNRRSITVSNIYGYGLLMAPAERSDVIVDFSAYAGQTLILYNDAPAPTPFNDERNDYYTANPDMTGTGGTYSTKPGYGPNTRTMMQVKVNGPLSVPPVAPAAPFNAATLLTALPAAYGLSQPTPIVPESAYNAAFGTTDADLYAHVATGSIAQPTLDFSTSGTVTLTGLTIITSGGTQNAAGGIVGNPIPGTGQNYDPANPPVVNFVLPAGASFTTPASAIAIVDPNTRQITGFSAFNPGSGYSTAPSITFTNPPGTFGVGAQATVTSSKFNSILVQTKAEQELFDASGRYNSTGGVELPLTTALTQTTVPLNYTDSATEIIGDSEVQIWKLVDNGFWSNSIHFDFVDVQLINRVGWDGTVKAPATNEVGWKDTVRLNPLEDVVVAMRAKHPAVPFGLPQSLRTQDPSVALGGASRGLAFTADPGVLSPAGVPLLTTTTNAAGNYDNEYFWSSAVLGHSEDDFMRPVVYQPTVVAPAAPLNLADATGNGTLTWTDTTPAATSLGNVQNEIGYHILKAPITNGVVGAFGPAGDVGANVTSWTETPLTANMAYEVVAYNVAGPSLASNIVSEAAPLAPTGLTYTTAFAVPATTVADVLATLNWTDNANNETAYQVSRSGGAGPVVVTPLPANAAAAPSAMTFQDPAALTEGTTYTYNVVAQNAFGNSTPVATVAVTAPVSVPLAPTTLGYTLTPVYGQPANVVLTWTDAAFNETSYTVTRTGGAGGPVTTALTGANFTAADVINSTGAVLTYVDTTALENNTYSYTVSAVNAAGAGSATVSVPFPITVPATPTGLKATPSTAVDANGVYVDQVALTWTDNAYNEVNYQVLRNGVVVATLPANTATGAMSYTDINLQDATTYSYTVAAVNTAGTATSAPAVSATTPGIVIAAPTAFTATPNRAGNLIALRWIDNANNETSYLVEESTNGGATWVNLPPVITRTAAQSLATGGVVTHQRTPSVVGTVYTFRVSARNVAQKSDSAYATATASLTGPAVPGVTTLAVPTVNARSGAVTLTWTAVTPAAGTTISYVVNINGGAVNGGTSVPVNGTTFFPTAAQMPVGSIYSVTVQTVATQFGLPNVSSPSNAQTVDLSVATPAAPALTKSTPVAAGGGLRETLSWLAVPSATGYVVQVSTNGGAYVNLPAINSGATVTLNANEVAGNTYSYQMTAVTTKFGVTHTSPLSNVVTVNTPAALSTGLTAVAGLAGTHAITVSGTNASANLLAAGAFTVQRRVGAGAWATITPVVTVTGTTFTFTDATGVTGTRYSYHVMANGTGGSSAYSAATAAVVAP